MKKKITTILCATLVATMLIPNAPIYALEEGKEPPIWDSEFDKNKPGPDEGKEMIWDDEEIEPETPAYDTRNKVEMLWDIGHNAICFKTTTVNWWNKRETTTNNYYSIGEVERAGFKVVGYTNRVLHTWAGGNMGVKKVPVFMYVK